MEWDWTRVNYIERFVFLVVFAVLLVPAWLFAFGALGIRHSDVWVGAGLFWIASGLVFHQYKSMNLGIRLLSPATLGIFAVIYAITLMFFVVRTFTDFNSQQPAHVSIWQFAIGSVVPAGLARTSRDLPACTAYLPVFDEGAGTKHSGAIWRRAQSVSVAQRIAKSVINDNFVRITIFLRGNLSALRRVMIWAPRPCRTVPRYAFPPFRATRAHSQPS